MMRFVAVVAVSFAGAGWGTGVAHAQHVRLDSEHAMVVSVSTGFDRSVLPVSVQWATRVDILSRSGVLGATWTMPMIEPDFGDQQGRVFAELDILPHPGWMLRVAHGWSLVATDNGAFSAVGLGTDLGVTAGWSSARWMLGAELSSGVTLVSLVTATQWATETGGVTASQGMVYGAAWTLRAGLRGALVLGPIETSLKVGWERLGDYSITPPMYAVLGIGFRFGPLGATPK